MKQFFTLCIFLVCKQIFSKCFFVANPAFGRIYGILLFLLAALRFSCAINIHNERFDTKFFCIHLYFKLLIEFLVYIIDVSNPCIQWNLNEITPLITDGEMSQVTIGFFFGFFLQFYKQPLIFRFAHFMKFSEFMHRSSYEFSMSFLSK